MSCGGFVTDLSDGELIVRGGLLTIEGGLFIMECLSCREGERASGRGINKAGKDRPPLSNPINASIFIGLSCQQAVLLAVQGRVGVG